MAGDVDFDVEVVLGWAADLSSERASGGSALATVLTSDSDLGWAGFDSAAVSYVAKVPMSRAVHTLAIGGSGAANAGLFAAQIIALGDEALAKRLVEWRAARTAAVPETPVDNP